MTSPPRRRRRCWTGSANGSPINANGSARTGTRCTVADLAAAERLRPVPKNPPIVVITVTRKATAQALVHYRGNRYSLPPELAGATVTVTHRAGGTTLAVVTGNGVTVAVHPRRADGTGATERTDTHVTALNTAAMTASTSAAPHRSKQRIPPGPDARAAAEALRTNNPAGGRFVGGAGDRPGPVRPGRRIPPHPALTAAAQPGLRHAP